MLSHILLSLQRIPLSVFQLAPLPPNFDIHAKSRHTGVGDYPVCEYFTANKLVVPASSSNPSCLNNLASL